jgi:hypothetical protein
MARPTKLPQWATNAGRTLEPSLGEKQVGWEVAKKPPARFMNWLQNNTYEWLQYLNDVAIALSTQNWTERANAKNVALSGVVHGVHGGSGADTWVAVGALDGADAYILTSIDRGANWIEQANAKNVTLNGVAHDGAGLFVAVGAADGVDAYILTSTDGGATWAERANPKNFTLYDVAYDGSGLFVAVGAADGADAYIITSPDGIVWTERANPKNFTLFGVAHDQSGLWVAVGQRDGTDGYLITSSDGINWTEQSNPARNAGDHLYDIVWANGLSLWVAGGAGAAGNNDVIITSPDGSTWTGRLDGNASASVVGYDPVNNVLISLGTSIAAAVSVDGITWTEAPALRQTGTVPSGIANDGAGLSIIVGGADGTDADILTSTILGI